MGALFEETKADSGGGQGGVFPIRALQPVAPSKRYSGRPALLEATLPVSWGDAERSLRRPPSVTWGDTPRYLRRRFGLITANISCYLRGLEGETVF